MQHQQQSPVFFPLSFRLFISYSFFEDVGMKSCREYQKMNKKEIIFFVSYVQNMFFSFNFFFSWKIGSCGNGNFASLSVDDAGGRREIKGISDSSPSQPSNLQVAAAPLLPHPQPFVQHSESMGFDSAHQGNNNKSAPGNSSSLGPQFVLEASKNVTALAGRVASLSCRIKNLDNWTVIFTFCVSSLLLISAALLYSNTSHSVE